MSNPNIVIENQDNIDWFEEKKRTWATPISASLFTAAVWALPSDWGGDKSVKAHSNIPTIPNVNFMTSHEFTHKVQAVS